MITAIIIDDEPKAIDLLLWELAHFKERIIVVEKFTQPEEALEFLKSAQIDCIFLDIEMPTMDGFTFLEKVENKNIQVVITTAYSEYAIQALKKDAVDYLLKPIDGADLLETIIRVEKKSNISRTTELAEKTLSNVNPRRKKIALNTDGKLIFVATDDIFYISSDGNYCTFFLERNKSIVVTKKLKEINEILPETEFFRVHNSYSVNLNKIKEFFKTDGYVILENNAKIPVSRQRKAQLLTKL